MPPFLTSLALKFIAAAVILFLITSAAVWVTHKVDDDKYKALQLADANALIKQKDDDAAALQAFNMRAATAMEATAAKLKTLAAQRVNQTQNLITTFTAESQKDATLASCMAMPLPPGIVQQLAH